MTQQDTVVTIDPKDAGGKRPLSLARIRQLIDERLQAARYAEAAAISMQAADQLPNDLWQHLVAAESLFLSQQIGPAFDYIDRALRIDPQSIAALVIKSRLHLHAGESAEGIAAIEEAIGLAPGNAQLRLEKGERLADAGNLDAAREAFLAAIGLDSRRAGSLLGLSRLPGDNISDELIKKIEFLIDSNQLPVDEQINAHFALAHAHDKKGDIGRHFRHLDRGNALKNKTLAFDREASRREAEGTVEFFSQAFLDRHATAEGNTAKIIFIVGFPRCGSTLVEQILSSHPAVSAAGETFALRHALLAFEQSSRPLRGYPYWLETHSADALPRIADEYLKRVRQFNHSDFLTDKMLDNYKFAGVIHLVFPNAKIIHVQRNPIDVCYSCYKYLFHLHSVPFSYSLENLASRYRDYRQVVRHWDKVLPGRIHTVDYEQLVGEQEAVTRALLDFCGLPWNDACLSFHRNARNVHTASNMQVRRPLYANAIDRWKKYAAHLGPLLELTND